MTEPTRRNILGAASLGVGALVWTGALAQPSQKSAPPPATPPAPKFGFDDVVKRARELAAAPFDKTIARLPDGLETLDFDGWRDIRFRPDKSIFAAQNSPFRMQLFHLGHLFRRPVTINTIRDGIATPIPYTGGLWDYGRAKVDKQLPVNTGFAGFRLHFPINNPTVYDEVCSFVGASYFRFLGRGQSYGLSARALAVETGTNNEEFPFFREYWIETPGPRADRVVFYGLLDGASVTGAYRFELFPGEDSVLEVRSTLFPRRSGAKFGIAPLTSMYFLGNNDRRPNSDFRTELHDSDGLQIHTQAGEWLWRPLRNPTWISVSSFFDKGTRGFGLLQRDRKFSSYQDLELNYQLRPSYWVETTDTFDGGRVELVELPTTDETNDNIVASFVPDEQLEQGKAVNFNYRIVSSLNMTRLSPNARTAYTFQAPARALGSRETPPAGSRRFLIDFSGGDLAYFSQDAGLVEAVASISQGSVIRAFVMSNAHVKGIRAIVDVQVPQGVVGDIRVFLRANGRTLTETWTFPWAQPQS
jgi:glucans biosynthesis protein